MAQWLRETSITKLINAITLAATVVVAAACLLVVLSLTRGTGGGYWGFDAHTSPRDAAQSALVSGDYRFLAYRLTDSAGVVHSGWPNTSECRGHPLGAGLHLKMNHTDGRTGAASVPLAEGFAAAFNETMLVALEMRYGADCRDTSAAQ